MTWRFINTGPGEAAMNMALDEAIFLLHEAGVAPPTLRVYGWQMPTLSLGYAQSTHSEVNLDACQQHGVVVVRRPTGGRAVLHDDEVTYSVIMPTAASEATPSLTAHYHLIGLALSAALSQVGLAVRLARPQRSAVQRAATSPACFAALSRYEISVAGRKLVGSAQKRSPNALLQHGSMPLTLDRQRLFQCFQVPPEQCHTLVQEAYATMTAIREVATGSVNPTALHEALRTGFAKTFEVVLEDGDVLPAEWDLAHELYATKYATPAWNLGGAAVWRRLGLEGSAVGARQDKNHDCHDCNRA
jgi:lipoate-protein ligase A